MKVLIAGDYYTNKNSDISGIKSVVDSVDYAIVNYESPVASDSCSPATKNGINMKSKPADVQRLKNVGFRCVTLANNHVLDYGPEGLESTFSAIDSAGLDRVGAGRNLDDAAGILYKTEGSETLAVINCCEHEFSIAGVDTPGTNPLNPVTQYRAIKQAREKADYVLVIVHGGHEHYKLPSPRMQEIYRFFIEVGADAVVNHHQHCYSGYEVYNGKPIFYGLGNFCFPLPTSSKTWQEGFLLALDFSKTEIAFQLHPYTQDFEFGVRLMDENAKKVFSTTICKLNETISDPVLLRKSHEEWMHSKSKAYTTVLLPYSNRFLVALWVRRLFPSFVSKKKILRWINYIDCESHKDAILHILKNKAFEKGR